MKLRACVFVVLVALVMTVAPGVAVADTAQYSGRVASAYAPVWGADPESPEMYVGVSAGEQSYKFHVPGTRPDKNVMSSADVWVDWPLEPANGAHVRFAMLSATPYDAGIDRLLSTAAVHTDVEGVLVEGTLAAIDGDPGAFELVDAIETPVTGRVDLDWVGSGDLVPYKFRIQDWGFGYRIFDRTSGKSRFATVTGTIRIDGLDIPQDLAFSGDISESRGMSIIHGEYAFE